MSAVAFAPDGKYLASYSHIDNKLFFWQVRKQFFICDNSFDISFLFLHKQNSI